MKVGTTASLWRYDGASGFARRHPKPAPRSLKRYACGSLAAAHATPVQTVQNAPLTLAFSATVAELARAEPKARNRGSVANSRSIERAGTPANRGDPSCPGRSRLDSDGVPQRHPGVRVLRYYADRCKRTVPRLPSLG